MMDVREKLVELLEPHMSGLACEYESGSCELTSCRSCNAKNIADHLIANGVTVQEWISVKDRLPDDEQEVLVIAHGWDGRLVYVGSHKRVEAQKSWLTGITNKSSEWSLWGWSYLKEPMVTHWMPLPQPPKGE